MPVPGPSHLQQLPNHPRPTTKAQGNPQVGPEGWQDRAGRANTTRKDGWTWVLRLGQSPAKGKTKLTPRSCPTRASSAHSSPLKIFLNKELSASGKPKPSPTGSQMSGEKEAVSFWHDTLVVGEGTHAGSPGLPPAMVQTLPFEASGRDRARMLVLPVWSDFGSSPNSPPHQGVASIRGQPVLPFGRLQCRRESECPSL